jgi:flavorubredoxin
MSIVKYIGVDDPDLDLFESQYMLPEGMCYNSYLIEDNEITIVDTVDPRKTDEWLSNLKEALNGQTPKYLLVQHVEPDHSGSIAAVMAEYPNLTIVASAKAEQFINQFFPNNSYAFKTVAEGDSLCIGKNTLSFIAAPMVHWPEVIVTYMDGEKILFSADAFGKFGVYNADPDDWACEARRYYFNIVGKYGVQANNVLQKAEKLDIAKICPLHGPVLEGEKMAEAIRLYSIWTKYDVETPGGILIAHASIHGNTKKAAEKLAEILKEKGAKKVAVTDLCRDDMAEAIEDAFKMGTLVLAASTYDGSVFPPMFYFLHKLQLKGFRNRRVGFIENGTWTPMAAKVMKEMVEKMKDMQIIDPTVTLKSTMKDENIVQMEALAEAIIKS